MTTRVPVLTFVVLALSFGGCYTSRASNTVRARHAGEFGCPEAKVKVTPLDFSWGVGGLLAEGCGTKTAYHCEGVNNCIRNGERVDTEPEEFAAPAAPASPAQKSTKDRLAELDDLHSQGLVTDEEYQQQRKAILDDI